MKCIFIIILTLIGLNSTAQKILQIDGAPCGPTGSATNGPGNLAKIAYEANPYKNRWKFPTDSQFDWTVTLNKLIATSAKANKFKQTKAADITGYVFEIKPGGEESCNCGTTTSKFLDIHIELTPSATDTAKNKRLVVEVTPRFKKLMIEKYGIDWSYAALKEKLEGKTILIQGWLFYDKIHEGESYSIDPTNTIGKKNWRASPWEIHPITYIELVE